MRAWLDRASKKRGVKSSFMVRKILFAEFDKRHK